MEVGFLRQNISSKFTIDDCFQYTTKGCISTTKNPPLSHFFSLPPYDIIMCLPVALPCCVNSSYHDILFSWLLFLLQNSTNMEVLFYFLSPLIIITFIKQFGHFNTTIRNKNYYLTIIFSWTFYFHVWQLPILKNIKYHQYY